MIFAARSQRARARQCTGDAAILLRRRTDFLANFVIADRVDPTVTYPVIAHLIERAATLKLTYPLNVRDEILVELSGFLTTLAMNYVYKGKFIGS